jgi:hypothetical protein
MNDIDMSRPGSELFPESAPALEAQPYNSYSDVQPGQFVGDPLTSGVKATYDDAGQGQLSDKEMNFRALREEAAKLKEQSEYWRGQAEALAKAPARPDPAPKEDPLASLDWHSGDDVQKAFRHVQEENQRLRDEMRDALASVATKSQHQDWNKMVTQHVPQLTSKNPIFSEMINNASNPYEAAYLLAELNQRATGSQQRAMMNAQKPQTLNSIGGNGTLSNADYYATMSDQDFMKVAYRNMESI